MMAKDPIRLIIEAMVWLKMASDTRHEIAMEKLELAVDLLQKERDHGVDKVE